MALTIILALIAGAAALWIIRPLVQTHEPRESDTSAEPLRALIAGLEADQAQHLISAANAEAESTAIARAVLSSVPQAPPVIRKIPRLIALVLAVIIPLLGIGIYFVSGTNDGVPSFTAYSEDRDRRVLVHQLAEAVARHPNDPKGHRLLGLARASLGEYSVAAEEFEKAIALGARTPDVLTSYGEMLSINEQSPPDAALQAFDEALNLAPNHLRARLDRAEARFSRKDFAGARDDLRFLLDKAPPGTDAQRMIARRMSEVEEALKGAAPIDQGSAQQAAMINAMVASLADKLAANPANLEGWLRLVHSYGVLGQIEMGKAALIKARQAFAQDPKALAALAQSEQALAQAAQ